MKKIFLLILACNYKIALVVQTQIPNVQSPGTTTAQGKGGTKMKVGVDNNSNNS